MLGDTVRTGGWGSWNSSRLSRLRRDYCRRVGLFKGWRSVVVLVPVRAQRDRKLENVDIMRIQCSEGAVRGTK